MLVRRNMIDVEHVNSVGRHRPQTQKKTWLCEVQKTNKISPAKTDKISPTNSWLVHPSSVPPVAVAITAILLLNSN